MVGGFVVDSIFLERIDLWQTQLVFATYTVACFLSIPLLHFIESRATERGSPFPRWRLIFPLITQFALGGFWSGFVIFYGRSASVSASWPFLVVLLLIFLGSEYFSRYHTRLVFTSILFFFALYAYAIFELPIWTGTLGTLTFLGSGLIAIGVFGLFTTLLRLAARERFSSSVWKIRFGAFLVLVLVNVSYFTNILPPLPLSAKATGVYHSVWRIPGNYLAISEAEPWPVRYLGFPPTLHIAPGALLYAYSSVFAPTRLTTTVKHEWQWYDPAQKRWITKAAIAYPIAGGRDGGYRGYSSVPIGSAGKWRVNVETAGGHVITRMPFTVVFTAEPVQTTVVPLQ